MSKAVRLGVYFRDDFTCVWCGERLRSFDSVSLDHIYVHSDGGYNRPTNLVTSCKKCNNLRGDMTAQKFANKVSRGHRDNRVRLLSKIEQQLCTEIPEVSYCYTMVNGIVVKKHGY